MDKSINRARAIREAAAQSGTSLLEMASRLQAHPERLEQGLVSFQEVARDTGFTVEEIEEMGLD